MEYKLNEHISTLELSNLRQSVGWPRMEQEYKNPKLYNFLEIACYDNLDLIGYVSVVSNYVTDAYIQDLMVRPDYQHKGIGTTLINQAINYIKQKGIYMISVIYGDESLKSFYERFGFYTMACGQMESYKL